MRTRTKKQMNPNDPRVKIEPRYTSINPEKEAEFTRKLKNIALKHCKPFNCRVFLFGSRVTGPVKRSSDFDIGIKGLGEDDFRHVKDNIVEEAEEANILHDVDVVNFDTLEEPMLSHAAKAVEVWKDWDEKTANEIDEKK
jgi:predicted nucleotidyltransferase